jgi:hypothetical protein
MVCLPCEEVQVRPQRARGEMLLPQPRGQFRDACGGVPADRLQDVDEIVVGVDLVQATGRKQALQERLGVDTYRLRPLITTKLGARSRVRSFSFASSLSLPTKGTKQICFGDVL